MAEKKRGKKRKEEYVPSGEETANMPSKDEFAVAKWMRKNVPIKKTKFLNHNVEYFTACKAVDSLMESHWVKGDDPFFKTRQDIADFLNVMLEHKFFHRARKVPVTEQELKMKKKDKKKDDSGDEKKKENARVKSKAGTDAESSVVEGRKEDEGTEKEKRKRKIRLDMHNDQRFVDGLDAYVWIYDPIPFYYWICGTLVVLGVIGVCLFPLWPPTVRLGVYYLSVAAAGFLVFIIVLAVLRLFIFCVVWLLTLGKHHIWILPNLTEDVGFFASFWPLYTYEYKGDKTESDKKTEKKKKKKEKDSDAEEEEQEQSLKDTKEDTTESPKVKQRKLTSEKSSSNEDGQKETARTQDVTPSSESDSESKSSTGKDFEIVNQDEFES